MNEQLRILAIGAHPDDCDIKAGGVACKYARRGHDVKFVSVTNGDAGHHERAGALLVRRRATEARTAAEVAGIEYEILDNHDGRLKPTLAVREQIIRLERKYEPDLVLTHRPNDYHPDHRYTSQLVQDAAYMATVPHICPQTPHLEEDPVIAYLSDSFEKPVPFSPDVVVAVDDVADQKLDMLDCHESQFYEWLPYNDGIEDQVPDDADERRSWLKTNGFDRLTSVGGTADRFRTQLVDRYGEKRGHQIQHAEAFEGCEYGKPLTEDAAERLFPF